MTNVLDTRPSASSFTGTISDQMDSINRLTACIHQTKSPDKNINCKQDNSYSDLDKCVKLGRNVSSDKVSIDRNKLLKVYHTHWSGDFDLNQP